MEYLLKMAQKCNNKKKALPSFAHGTTVVDNYCTNLYLHGEPFEAGKQCNLVVGKHFPGMSFVLRA